jgi:hypothetical protein
MNTVNSYRLVAYESGKIVFDLANYVDVEAHLLSKGTVLIQNEVSWEIIGLRKDSTPEIQRVDVKKRELSST